MHISKTWKLFPLIFLILLAHSIIICLGKALERIITRRLIYIALKCKLFSLLHFSAISCCSVVDAATTFTYNIEKVFQDREIIITLALVIKKAFDRVMDSWFVKRLKEQSISLTLIKWVVLLLNDRTAAFKLNSKTED